MRLLAVRLLRFGCITDPRRHTHNEAESGWYVRTRERARSFLRENSSLCAGFHNCHSADVGKQIRDNDPLSPTTPEKLGEKPFRAPGSFPTVTYRHPAPRLNGVVSRSSAGEWWNTGNHGSVSAGAVPSDSVAPRLARTRNRPLSGRPIPRPFRQRRPRSAAPGTGSLAAPTNHRVGTSASRWRLVARSETSRCRFAKVGEGDGSRPG